LITPLHVHSDGSNLDAVSMPVEIAFRCKEIDAPCCAITDHGVVTQHHDFYKTLTKHGIKPILGIEAYHGIRDKTQIKGKERDQAHLILLAMNLTGVQNLWRMVTEAADPKYYKYVPRITWEMLEKYNEGLIATSACALGLVPRTIMAGDFEPLNRYLSIFGDRFYIELSSYDHRKPFEDFDQDGEPRTTQSINEALVATALERGLPMTIGDDAHYASPTQYEFYDAYLAAKLRKKEETIYTPPEERQMWHPNCLYIKSADDIRERLSYLPANVVGEAIDNCNLIGEAAQTELPGVRRHLPVFVPSDSPWLDKHENRTSEQLFIDLVESGVSRRYPDAGPDVWDRAVREMEIFLDAGLHHYFLLAWDLCEFCDRNAILRGPGRGSSAGCLVAYALGITDVDPLRYGLIFERFWNPGRAKGFPDIDSDFARASRADVINYLRKRWGEERVRPIGTTGRLKPKAAIEKFYKACAMSWEEMDELKKIISQVPDIDIHGSDQIAWSREGDPDFQLTGRERKIYVEDHVGAEVQAWIKSDRSREDLRVKYVWLVQHLVNRIAGYGIHASGIVISDTDLPEIVPSDLRGDDKEKIEATAFTMDEVDELMLVKFDVLGLKTLDTLYDWIIQVKEQGVELDWSGLDLLDYPDEMWELLHRGFTAGIFQVEGGFAKRLCKDFKPTSVEDLAIIVALNRPGPIRSGAPERFIARRNGSEPVEFDHPILESILNVSYGLFIYQEQVIAYFNKLGYNLSESDAVRKILGKKKPEDLDALRDGIGEWDFATSPDQITIQPKDFEGSPVGEPIVITDKGYFTMTRLNSIPDDVARVIWDKIVGFASYSFNKSHAIAYAVVGFRCLLAKYYAPAEFYRACINTVENSKKATLVPTYIAEAGRLNIKVFPPDILTSEADVRVKDGNIYLGFGNVKGVASGGELIVTLRDDGVNMQTPEALAEELERRAKEIAKARAEAKKRGEEWNGPIKTPKQILQSNKIQALLDVGAWDSLGERDVSKSVKQAFEKNLLGCIITDDAFQILDDHADELEDLASYLDIEETEYEGFPIQFTVPGVITEIRPVLSKAAKKPMGIVTIEYEGDTIEFVVSPPSWKASRFLFKERTPGIFTLALGERGISFESGKKLT
jgi:DNA polymerase-3 subunit alpha